MQPAAPEISVCPSCGLALAETSRRGLGCMNCLLRVGIGGEDAGFGRETVPEDARFGVYEIERREDGSLYELGHGAMGVTYRAIDTTLQRKVALKIIYAGIAGRNAEARERFTREARAAAALRHENIATVFQFGIREETGQCFYAMELIEGETLDQRVRRAGPLGVGMAINIAKQVASALITAEECGVIHRDLKPANLMLVSRGQNKGPNGNELLVKIIDFGLAKALHAPVDSMSLTRDGFVGTPAFASPEQFEHSALDVRSDVYSLGETLWFALTGKTPFAGRSPEEIHGAQQSNALPIEQLKAAHIPHRLRSLLGSMLALEPAARPGTHDLAARLQRCSAEASGVRRARIALAAAFVLLFGVSAFFVFRPMRTHPPTAGSASNLAAPEKSIAVLPFENLSRDPDNAFFADGVHEEILTRLSKIADLKVISRTSTQHYKSAPENLREIAKQLGVSHILEGSVQKSGDAVRVNVQLIKAAKDSHRWAETYDRKLIDVFDVESDIAQKIAASLEANLTGREKRDIAVVGTKDPEAYDAFLHALALKSKQGFENAKAVIGFCRRAVEIDPSYAEAWALLGIFEAQNYFFPDHSKAQLTRARIAAETALGLAPELADGHVAMGNFYYYCLEDFDRALRELELAHDRAPNDANILATMGNVQRRQGRLDEAIQVHQQSAKLDPLNQDVWVNLGRSYRAKRKFDEARAMFDRALVIAPADVHIVSQKAETYLAEGDLDTTAQLMSGLNPMPTDPGFPVQMALFIYRRQFDEAIAELSPAFASPSNIPPMFVGLGHAMLGYFEIARGDRPKAQPLLLQAEHELKSLQAKGDNSYLVGDILVQVEAQLGHREDVERDARSILERIKKDAWGFAREEEALARAYTLLGDFDRAVPLLQHALAAPSQTSLTPALLRLDPFWDPVRSDPRFQELCKDKQPARTP
jgi:serine/threonine protein kinase/tetratricopeptide (TPR) repeat protein